METSFFDSINDFHGEGKFGKYKVTHRIVKTNLFGNRSVHAYVTSSSKGARRLFFSTASVPELHMSCAWLENSELRNCPVEEAFFYPLKLYKLRWSIETNYYEHKTFWSIDKYMVRKHIGIERLLNIINIAHSMTKILPYIDNMFYEYRNMSAQEFRHKLNELINKEIFLAVWLIVPKLPKIPISSWSSWQLWVGIRVMQRKNCKVLSI